MSRTFGSLFSGIGGLDLGLERAGWECKWQVENDPYCSRVLAKHWPDVPRHGDIYEVKDLPRVELIAGGFPCQPFSHAGRRSAEADDRYLWPQMLRVVRETRPHFVLAENVYGLVTSRAGLVLETVYLDLEGEGYEVGPPVVFPAAAIGALHRRDRVWICAHSRHDGWCAEQGEQQEERPEEPDGVRKVDQGRSSAHGDNRLREHAQGSLQAGRIAPVGSFATNGHGLLAQGNWASGLEVGRAHEEPLGTRWGSSHRGIWDAEPAVDRVANGVSGRVDRIKALGNAVVPQVAEVMGRLVMESCVGRSGVHG